MSDSQLTERGERAAEDGWFPTLCPPISATGTCRRTGECTRGSNLSGVLGALQSEWPGRRIVAVGFARRRRLGMVSPSVKSVPSENVLPRLQNAPNRATTLSGGEPYRLGFHGQRGAAAVPMGPS